MTISVGDTVPDARLLIQTDEGPRPVELGEKMKGRRIVLVGMPGAFTGTCTSAHIPSLIRTRAALEEAGIDEIVVVTVNDPQVVRAWGEATGATAAGLTLLADADASFTRAIGMDFTAPAAGFYNRSRRFLALVDDGKVTYLQEEVARGTCDVTAGETLLEYLRGAQA